MAERKHSRPRDVHRLKRIERKLDQVLEILQPENLAALNKALGKLEKGTKALKDTVDQNSPAKG